MERSKAFDVPYKRIMIYDENGKRLQ